MKRGVRRFFGIEVHPAIYVSIVSINLAVFFAYQANRQDVLAESTNTVKPIGVSKNLGSAPKSLADATGISELFGVTPGAHSGSFANGFSLTPINPLKLAWLNPDFGSPNVKAPLKTHQERGPGTASAGSLDVVPFQHLSSRPGDHFIPPAPQVFTAKPRPIRRSKPSPYLVPPPPPMIPGPDVALWSNSSNIGLPANVPIAYDSPPSPPMGIGNERSVHAEHVRIRSFHQAKQLLVSR